MIPGFSLHQELESLVRNGMTTAQALRAATAVPAEVMGSNAGVIEVDRRADLLMLSANPLDDISNTTSIDLVVSQGRVYDRQVLDAMLDRVEGLNAESRKFDLDAYR
jgi:imidazolonepropionase-like amidohydrolase